MLCLTLSSAVQNWNMAGLPCRLSWAHKNCSTVASLSIIDSLFMYASVTCLHCLLYLVKKGVHSHHRGGGLQGQRLHALRVPQGSYEAGNPEAIQSFLRWPIQKTLLQFSQNWRGTPGACVCLECHRFLPLSPMDWFFMRIVYRVCLLTSIRHESQSTHSNQGVM